jgi:signal transduction histidine kinase
MEMIEVTLAAGLLQERAMTPAAPLTSGQWLTRIGLLVGLAASEVLVLALNGVGAARVLAVAAAAVVFVFALLVMPSPGKAQYDAGALRAVLAMTTASLVAIAVTGGFTSPMLPLVAAPIVTGWTMYQPRRELALALAPMPILIVLWIGTRNAASELAPVQFVAIACWTTFLTAWLIGRRVTLLFEALRTTSTSLSRVCHGALSDAASRRRGLELMTTKLAHELKNPLAVIKSLVQVELRNVQDDRSRRRLDVVLAESERINALLRDYLDLARPVESVQLEPLQLDDLMSEICSLLNGRAEVAAVELSVTGSGGALHADARLLKEAIVNVVSNAIEATPRGGSVTVSYHLGAQGASIVVRDTGKGMTKEVSTRIGTPFFTTRAGGTGLGVVIARSAIAQHRGKLDYASTPGVGTIATIALPLDPRLEPQCEPRPPEVAA